MFPPHPRILIACSLCDRVVESYPEALLEQGWVQTHRDPESWHCFPCHFNFLTTRLHQLEERVDSLLGYALRSPAYRAWLRKRSYPAECATITCPRCGDAVAVRNWKAHNRECSPTFKDQTETPGQVAA